MAKKIEIDWEQRRYDLAKTLLPKVIELDETKETSISYRITIYNNEGVNWAQAIARVTLEFVDELLLRLKNNELKLD